MIWGINLKTKHTSHTHTLPVGLEILGAERVRFCREELTEGHSGTLKRTHKVEGWARVGVHE